MTNVEQDPYGLDSHTSGAKLDQGKNRLGLVFLGFSKALEAVGEVGTYGSTKYSDNGWREVPRGFERYTDALFRHLFKEPKELRDLDTNFYHAAHAAWNALARLELLIDKQEQTK
jgi:hypothetical protein